jgi:hypothetical protein
MNKELVLHNLTSTLTSTTTQITMQYRDNPDCKRYCYWVNLNLWSSVFMKVTQAEFDKLVENYKLDK